MCISEISIKDKWLFPALIIVQYRSCNLANGRVLGFGLFLTNITSSYARNAKLPVPTRKFDLNCNYKLKYIWKNTVSCLHISIMEILEKFLDGSFFFNRSTSNNSMPVFFLSKTSMNWLFVATFNKCVCAAFWTHFQGKHIGLSLKRMSLLLLRVSIFCPLFLLSYSIRLEMLYKQHILLLLRFILVAVFLNFRLTLPLDHFLFCLCWSAPRRVVVSSTESHPFSSSSTIWHAVIHL